MPMAGEAVAHWRGLVEARRQQMDAAYARLNRSSADYWARRVQRFRRSNTLIDENMPLVQRVRALLPPGGTVLDVGAGTGRFALPIARFAGRVTALEPAEAMLAALEESARAAGLSNIETVQSGWLEAEAGVPPADVVLCAHVLYPHAEIDRWIATLDAHARHAVVIETVVRWVDPDALNELWRRFHGDERVGQPGLAELYAVLLEMGIPANVEIYRQPSTLWHFASLDEAVAVAREHVIVAESPENDAIVRDVLATALRLEGEALTLPYDRIVACVWWEREGPRLPPA
jgi:SAM-dependent methyltransferase